MPAKRIYSFRKNLEQLTIDYRQEKGRWENIVRSNRHCTLCNLNLLGDEYHYILECTYFTEKHKLYLPKYYLKHVNVFKFQKVNVNKKYEVTCTAW